jgi:TRAP-type C4-dicarboxylate transport system permease small subunit
MDSTVLKWLDKNFEEVLCTACLTTVASCIMFQVILRYVFGSASSWAEEVAVYGMIFAVYFGAALGVRERAHIRITLLVNALPRKLAVASVVLADFLWISFVGFMVWQTIIYTQLLFDVVYISPGLGIDQKWVQIVIPISLVLMIFRILQVYWRWAQDQFEGLPL